MYTNSSFFIQNSIKNNCDQLQKKQHFISTQSIPSKDQMKRFYEADQFMVKQEHSEIFTLKSIGSQEEIIQVVPGLYHDPQSIQCKSGHWSTKQHIKYVMFIDYFSDIFNVKHNIKLWKIFTVMSSFIKTRNPSQCRSHHQKTQRKYHSIQQVLKIQKAKYRNYENQFQKIKQQLTKLPIHNPLQVKNYEQKVQSIPSLKILYQDIQNLAIKNSSSFIDFNQFCMSEKSQNKLGSQQIAQQAKQKIIHSQVSIQMEDQNDQFSLQKNKLLLFVENQVENSKEKHISIIGHSNGSNSQRRNDKFDHTTDSAFNDGVNKTVSQQKSKYDSLPQKQSVNIQQDQIPAEQGEKISSNLVRRKRSRTRSMLPSSEFIDHDEKPHPSQFLKQYKMSNLKTPEGKCKTLPPRSIFMQSEDPWANVQRQNQGPAMKSIFSNFNQYSLQGKRNQQENDQNEFGQQNYIPQNLVERQIVEVQSIQENQSKRDSEQVKEEISHGGGQNYCKTPNQIIEKESFEFQEPNYSMPQQNKDHLQGIQVVPCQNNRKFHIMKQNTQQFEKSEHQKEIYNFDQLNQPPQINQRPNSFSQIQQISHQSFDNYQYGQYFMTNYQNFYHPQFQSQNYAFMHPNYQQATEFYIYFLMQMIQMGYLFHSPG